MDTAKKIARLEKIFSEYRTIEEKEKALNKQIDELKSKVSALKTERQQVGDIIVKLGRIEKKYSYLQQDRMTRNMMERLKTEGDGKINPEKYKEEHAKLKKEFEKITIEPCMVRTWNMRQYSYYSNDEKGYYMSIDNHDYNSICDHYETGVKTYSVSVKPRPELKKYKLEIHISWPDTKRYNENIIQVVKCKDFTEVSKIIPGLMQKVEAAYREQNAKIFEIAPDTFDFSIVELDSDIKPQEIPFSIEGKTMKL